MSRVTWVCLECGQATSVEKYVTDGIRCIRCGGRLEIKGSRLTTKIDAEGLEQYKRLATVIGELALDERIHKIIRMEYMNKIMMDKG